MARKTPIGVYLDPEQAKWLDGKAEDGYKKSSLMRLALEKLMAEKRITWVHKAKKKPKFTYGSIEEAISDHASDDDLPPKLSELTKAMDYGFKNIDRLDPRAAFLLGGLKERLENKLKVGVYA
jgi:hypothetical protein